MSKKLFECEIDYIKENCPIYGVKKTAKAIGRGVAIVRTAIKKHSIETPKKGEALDDEPPLFNKDYINFSTRFEKITPELAYWIGFFWADGSINLANCMRIEITEKDGEDLKNFFLSIFPFFINKRARKNKKAQMSFSVTDARVAELLKKLGKYPNSSESHEKVLCYLNNEKLTKYFLRGLIDGDGNFYLNKNFEYAQFTLASNLKQDWSYLEKILSEFNPNISIEKTFHGNSSILRITGKDNLVKFITFLEYENVKIGLNRKNSKAIEILEMYRNKPYKKAKAILQFEIDGTFVKEWISSTEIAKCFHCSNNTITMCCNGVTKTSMGYIWRYKDKI